MNEEGDQSNQNENRKRMMSAGLYVSAPAHLKAGIEAAFELGYHFIITQITHPNYTRNLLSKKPPLVIGRTDRILKGSEWNRLVVAELTRNINVDSEIKYIEEQSKAIFNQELGFASHLGVPAVLITLNRPRNVQLSRIINEKMAAGSTFAVWVQLPMVHPSQYSPIADEKHDSWKWWNDFRIFCHYDKKVGLVLEIPDIDYIPSSRELDRWVGEPVKALLIPTSLFLKNQYGKPVLSKVHQEVIRKFMSIDVQYIIQCDSDGDQTMYTKYLSFLGKKLYKDDPITEFAQGCEDFLQNPLQPLAEHLETNIYEVFEKDNTKYERYQLAILAALRKWENKEKVPVVMVVGAGRGPLVQAVINVSNYLDLEVKLYVVEKNPFAINTLVHRAKKEWDERVTLVFEDMRTYVPPEQADFLVSELLGSFGDNELCPECLDGAQRFLKRNGGISIPQSYSSYLAPMQSFKIYNDIKASRLPDKTMLSVYETPYIVHLVNYYQLSPAKELFTFSHPNWSERINNQRYKKLSFRCEQSAVLTGFVGYFDTVLYGDVTLSINPETHTEDMFSWFPIVFSLLEPVHVKEGDTIEVHFWRLESHEKVWYEWCLESPLKTTIMNPGGRSYSIKKI